MKQDFVDSVFQEQVKQCVQAHDEFIMEELKRQEGFINLEESKHLVKINRIYIHDKHIQDEYMFNGFRFLSIGPPEFKYEDNKGTISYSYNRYSK